MAEKKKAGKQGEKPKAKKKTGEESKVFKKYIEPAPITKSYKKVTLSKLKLNMIKTGYLQGVYIDTEGDDVIELTSSWEELCILLLGTIHSSHPTDFLKILVKNKVLSSDFEVTTDKKLTIDSKSELRIYSLADTEFNIVIGKNTKSMLTAICGMITALNLKKEQIKFDIVPIGKATTAVRLTEGTATIQKKQLTLNEAFATVNEGSRLHSISILGSEYKTDSFFDATIKLLEYIAFMYGEDRLLKAQVCNVQSVGISEVETITCLAIEKLPSTKLFVYNNDETGCVEYMFNICYEFKISSELIQLDMTQMYFNKE